MLNDFTRNRRGIQVQLTLLSNFVVHKLLRKFHRQGFCLLLELNRTGQIYVHGCNERKVNKLEKLYTLILGNGKLIIARVSRSDQIIIN